MWKSFVLAIFGGASIGIGATIYLSVDSPVVGSFLFSLGLFTIYTFGFNLFTGKVCYIPNKSLSYLREVAVVYAGNVVGTALLAGALRETRLVKLVDHCQELALFKLSDTLYSTWILAILCGVMMSIAVLGFQTIRDSVGKHLALVLPIMVFILAGFEHSIADLFYFSLAGVWSEKAVLFSLVIALGNLLGGALIPLTIRLVDGRRLGLEEPSLTVSEQVANDPVREQPVLAGDPQHAPGQ